MIPKPGIPLSSPDVASVVDERDVARARTRAMIDATPAGRAMLNATLAPVADRATGPIADDV